MLAADASFLVLLLVPATGPIYAARVTREVWGKTASGDVVDRYTLKDGDAEVQVSTYGARITSIRVPDRAGKVGNVVLGFDAVEPYLGPRNSVMGATVGRYANRIANGEFNLNGTTYHIPKNNGANALHGGTIGFDKKVWSAAPVRDGVSMTLLSPDGEMGFPGNLTVKVTFELVRMHGSPALRITYLAHSDRKTVINLTNHAYFNLADDPSTPVFDDLARIEADEITPVDAGGIPTGALQTVAGTPYDFRTMHAFQNAIPERGYDQNFALRQHKKETAVAEVDDLTTGRTIQVLTDQPGLQLYVPKFPTQPATANMPARRGTSAFCLETQHFPDAPNHPTFPATTLEPGKAFHSVTTYIFGVTRTTKPSIGL